jgi:hypothetical protein
LAGVFLPLVEKRSRALAPIVARASQQRPRHGGGLDIDENAAGDPQEFETGLGDWLLFTPTPLPAPATTRS